MMANSVQDAGAGEASLPLVRELIPAPDAEAAFHRLSHLPHCLFFDSALRHPSLGRYSFLAVDPLDFLTLPVGATRPLEVLHERLRPFQAERRANLPPFQGGLAGMFSYDLNRSLERLPAPACDEFQLPAVAVGLYDLVLAFDHVQNRAWIISQGFPEVDPQRRAARAAVRMQQMFAWLDQPLENTPRPRASAPALPRSSLAESFPVDGPPGLASNFSRAQYLEAIRSAIEYIRAGDVFQVNLAQRLILPAIDNSVSLYLRMRKRNAAPFAGYFDLGPVQLASASPERFVQVLDRLVETRPIKGTRRRTRSPEADLFSGDELQQSEKDRAENIMIVDLLRNDLSRVCKSDSVLVAELCALESYAYVQHLVSSVRGRLRDGVSAIDLLGAMFPGGSITGAPKIRAMEIIAELEPTARGAYCGSLAYIGFDGNMDSSILIRTVTAAQGWWSAPVGGGIVAQSVPLQEYEETWHKAAGLIRAFV